MEIRNRGLKVIKLNSIEKKLMNDANSDPNDYKIYKDLLSPKDNIKSKQRNKD